jgi:hypothetical protein
VLSAPSSRPVPLDPSAYAVRWYRQAQRKDPWPGENYSGTSVLAGCLVGRQRQLWSGFRWAKNPAELAHGLQDPALGPAVIGVAWSEELYETDRWGVMRAGTLDPNMGHCVLVVGFVPHPDALDGELREDLTELDLLDGVETLEEPSFLILNSWGPGYGRNGLAVAPLSLVRRWFSHHGEFAFPENRQPATRAGVQERKDLTVTETPVDQVQDSEVPVLSEPDQEPDDGTQTLHLQAADVRDGDRVLDPPEELGQESATVQAAPQQLSGRRVRIRTTAGSFVVSAGTSLAVRRERL